MTAGSQAAINFLSPKQGQYLKQKKASPLVIDGPAEVTIISVDGDIKSEANKVTKRELFVSPNINYEKMGIIDFRMSKSFHNRFLSPTAASNNPPKLH